MQADIPEALSPDTGCVSKGWRHSYLECGE
jgi:hypothetical protein